MQRSSSSRRPNPTKILIFSTRRTWWFLVSKRLNQASNKRSEAHRVPCGGHKRSYTNRRLEEDDGLAHVQASGMEVVESEGICK